MRTRLKQVLLAAGLVAVCLILTLATRGYSSTYKPEASGPISLGAVDYLGALRTPADVKGKPSRFRNLLNKALGLDGDYRRMVLPHGVAVDSRGRVLVADTKGQVVHVFDAAKRSYKQIHPPAANPFLSPIAIALDSQGRIYVTDSGRSLIFVFRPDGKFLKTIGALGRNESIFKRCTGLAIDRRSDTLYVVDTVAMRVVVLNSEGQLLNRIGKPGDGPAEFNYPTHIAVAGDGTLWVVDSLNFRVQHLDASGKLWWTPAAGFWWWKAEMIACRPTTLRASCCSPSATPELRPANSFCLPASAWIAKASCTSPTARTAGLKSSV
jgi:6-bladed beta-propeller/NHL repeat